MEADSISSVVQREWWMVTPAMSSWARVDTDYIIADELVRSDPFLSLKDSHLSHIYTDTMVVLDSQRQPEQAISLR